MWVPDQQYQTLLGNLLEMQMYRSNLGPTELKMLVEGLEICIL